jgi:hypothetical protein
MKKSTKVETSTKKSSFENLDQKYKDLMDQKKFEFMGVTECHGKLYYRFRNITTKVINHRIIPELAKREVVL